MSAPQEDDQETVAPQEVTGQGIESDGVVGLADIWKLFKNAVEGELGVHRGGLRVTSFPNRKARGNHGTFSLSCFHL